MQRPTPSIWWFALGYFACYWPYSALTKAITSRMLPGMPREVDGFELLPPTVFASLLGMIVFLSAMRWWRYATPWRVAGVTLRRPTALTLLSGLGTATIIATTTLAYTFSGVSIVFMMLLMRGGLLVLAPLVDASSGRKVGWNSWIALALSVGALVVALGDTDGYRLTTIAVVDVVAYLASYFVRLRLMSGSAKSADPDANRRFFVEEQLVATPATMLLLSVAAGLPGEIPASLRAGFGRFWLDSGVVLPALAVGLCSQGTGIFGALILLDKRENSFCVPVNRSSSILAGLLASTTLALTLGGKWPTTPQFIGAGMVLLAIGVLSAPGLLARRSRGA